MKIAVISDTHDNLANLEKFFALARIENYEGLIHCGDIAKIETLELLAQNFSGPIKISLGNAEINREDFSSLVNKYPNLEIFSEIGEWFIEEGGEKRLTFTHKPEKAEELALLAKDQPEANYPFIFYGHTHKPWIKQLGATLIANPGTLGGIFSPPTYAILDTGTLRLELKRI